MGKTTHNQHALQGMERRRARLRTAARWFLWGVAGLVLLSLAAGGGAVGFGLLRAFSLAVVGGT